MNSTTTYALCLLGAISASPVLAQGTKRVAPPKKDRPNIIWFLTEDVSPHYVALFQNGKGVKLPNVESLAKQGLIYTNAYCNAPVSSAARTTLITGCYTPRFAGSLHRKIQEVPLPGDLRMFPSYLRQAGYYTSNAIKTDYNVVLDEEAWDDIKGKVGGWRARKSKDQPFFYMRSNTRSHESCLHFNEDAFANKPTRNDPASVFVHPYLPDTDLMRYTYATFYDRIQDADQELGKIIQMLKEDGELDDTFIFFMGDNGGSLPGTKGYTDDMGLRVPFVVYVPENWKHEVDLPLGSEQDRLVAFMDFAPTVLSLANVEIPKEMDGKAFLGRQEEKPNKAVFGYGDRFDELYAFNRIARKGNYRYARNFQPYQTQSLYNAYRYKQLAFQEWANMYDKGDLNEYQGRFFEPFGAEELYDVVNDPYEKTNLAQDPAYKKVLKDMRATLQSRMLTKGDLGFYPETVILEEAITNPGQFAQDHKKDIKQYDKVANYQIENYGKVASKLAQSLESNDPVEQWWALTGLAYFAKDAKQMDVTVSTLLDHPRSYVRSRALVALALMNKGLSTGKVVQTLRNCKTGAEALLVLNDLAYLAEHQLLPKFKMVDVKELPENSELAHRIAYIEQCWEK